MGGMMLLGALRWSFPRSAWECSPWRSASTGARLDASGAAGTRSVP